MGAPSPSGVRNGGGHRRRWGVVAAVLGLMALAIFLLGFRTRPPDEVQPFPFNHKVHIAAKLDCLTCHAGLLDPDEDRLPKLAKCMSCHPEGQDDKPAKHQLRKLVASVAPVSWKPLIRVPEHVFFSHPRHVDVAGLECLDCHGEMPSLSSPPLYLRTISMDRCIECHEKHRDNPAARRAVKANCADCHR